MSSLLACVDNSSMEDAPDPALPLEILERIMALVHDKPSLNNCSQSSRSLVQPAQRELFRAVNVQKHTNLALFQVFLQQHPHIVLYIHSVALLPGQVGVMDILGMLPRLRRLLLGPREYLTRLAGTDGRPSLLEGTFSHDILRNLAILFIQNLRIPFSLITSCSRLVSLTLLNIHIQIPEDGILPVYYRSASLRILVLDETRNFGRMQHSPITTLIAQGCYPSLRSLRIPQRYRYGSLLPEKDLAIILDPLASNLRCLDIELGPGDLKESSVKWTHRNPLYIGRFSNLVMLNVSLIDTFDDLYLCNALALCCLHWLIQMFQAITVPHPLSTLVFTDAANGEPRNLPTGAGFSRVDLQPLADTTYDLDDPPSSIRVAWTRMDQVLHSSLSASEPMGVNSNLRFPLLSKVVIPLKDSATAYRETAVSHFQADLAMCYRTGKLSFEEVDIEDAFWSLSSL
ncbi:hypothetical protein DL96DRAFT_1715499 [Flagelloscypha sp. PMI_526]|nr:hypothetical protein DL96DRAFT_1715499 [Flagelloscypha sp. PMI_526]